MKNKQLEKFKKSLNVILKISKCPSSTTYLLQEFIKRVERLSNNNGPLYAIDHVKNVRMALTAYIAGKPLKQAGRVGLTPDGLPKILKNLKKKIRLRDKGHIRNVLTALQVSHVINGQKPIDTSSITGKPKRTRPFKRK